MLQNIAHQSSNEAQELRSLFEKLLKEIYWATDVLLSVYEDMKKNSTSKDLITLIEKNGRETSNHRPIVVKIFESTGIEAQALSYEAIECYIKEASDLVNYTKRGVVRDAAIIAILQKIKHYEIACYGTLRAYAIALREEHMLVLLEEMLKDAKQADLELSHIAESHINIEAADKEI
ncbi:MAG: hypothetical protein DI539_18645 [Flavobacterium psychrophilum]|nr:MAG: hypothetical protein DI539_18645 [Flavobacterium psychrophilum]